MIKLSIYFIFNAFLFIMGAYIFYKTTPDLMKKRLYLVFKVFIGAFGAYLIANTLWTMQEFDVVQMPLFVFKLVCFLSYVAVLFNTVCFYKFTMIYYGYSDGSKKLYHYLGLLPFAIMIVLLFISIWTGMIFSVSNDMNVVQGKFYFGLVVCAAIYFMIIVVSSLVEMFRTKSPQARRNCLTIFLVVIFLLFWVVIDNLYDGLTVIPLAIFAVILVLFTTFQQSSINTDALTQINNRRRAVEYLSAQLENVSSDNPLYLYMCDVNYFKKINDEYGHPEGDSALIILSTAIKIVIGQMRGFAARYGGDEFLVALRPQNSEFDEAEVMRRISEVVEAKCVEANKPYVVRVAYGYVKCDNNKRSLDSYIKEVDVNLYESKKNR